MLGYEFDYDEFHAEVHGKLPYDNLKPDPVLKQLLLSMPQRKIVCCFSKKNCLFLVYSFKLIQISIYFIERSGNYQCYFSFSKLLSFPFILYYKDSEKIKQEWQSLNGLILFWCFLYSNLQWYKLICMLFTIVGTTFILGTV